MRRLPALLLFLLPLAPAQADAVPTADTYVVVLRDGTAVTPDRAAAEARSGGAGVRAVYRHALRGYAATFTAAGLAAVKDDPAVASVTANAPVHAFTTQPSPTWGLDRIDQRSLPLSASYTYSATGAGVTAYVIDSGIRFSHSDFGGRAVSGIDTVDGGTADDCAGHGTHVAGTVGGATYGVAKAVRLVSVRVLDCSGNGDVVGVLSGIDWVTQDHLANPNVPAVANMSLGSNVPLPPFDAAVSASIASGVTYSLAAGNNGDHAGACLVSPARVPEAMTIGASTWGDYAAVYSNHGPCVDWYAPGFEVVSAWHTGDTATRSLYGTSMAAPHNTGVAAQFLQGNPTATPAQVQLALANRLTQNVIITPDPLTEDCPAVLAQVCQTIVAPADNNDLLFSGF